MKQIDKDIVLYLLEKIPDQHPFRLSRLLFLLDAECEKKNGKQCTSFEYVVTPYGFYIDKFPPFLEEIDGIEKIEIKDEQGNPVKGFFRLTKEVNIDLPADVKDLLDSIISAYGHLADDELHQRVTSLPEYQKRIKN